MNNTEMTWFKTLTGLKNETRTEVYKNLSVDGSLLTSKANGQTFNCGRFSTPILKSLRSQSLSNLGKLELRECVGDVSSLHQDPKNENAVFQVASQFNCLEMAFPSVTPEEGVGIYQNDFTQGPACSISAGAGTIYRNYFVPLKNQIGQTKEIQINCLSELENYFGDSANRLWKMTNGYCMPTESGLQMVNQVIQTLNHEQYEEVCGLLKVGVQSETEVTLKDCGHPVTQVFCSALPIAYTRIPKDLYKPFAKLVLEATYEATFRVALENCIRTGCNRLYLTLIGGGVFGNPNEWIIEAIEKSIRMFLSYPLDVRIVSYGSSNPSISDLVDRMKTELAT